MRERPREVVARGRCPFTVQPIDAPFHYFDHNATTPLSPAAREAWLAAQDRHWQNPSSLYREAAAAREKLESLRETLAELIGADDPETLVLTSGATESNNLVLAAAARRALPGQRVLISAQEHPAVVEPARRHFGDRVDFLPADATGRVLLDGLDHALATSPQPPALVAVMAAGNETGLLQPWREIQSLCTTHGVPFHCDAAQHLGKLPSADLGACDFLTGSAHKFGGPKGCGFLKIPSADFPLLGPCGGPQENGHRAGTEDLPALAALVAALTAAESWLANPAPRLAAAAARDAFESALPPGSVVLCAAAPRLWNTSQVVLPAHDNRLWLGRLSQLGFAVSTGSACSAATSGASRVLTSLGLTSAEARRVLRFSAGPATTAEDWHALAAALRQTHTALDNRPAAKSQP